MGEILIILWIFLKNFIQKYEFYIRVYYKVETKSEDEKLLGTKNRRIFGEKLNWKSDIFIGKKNIFNPI